MFIDETTIQAKAGDGGNGCFAYERQKYKPKGPPAGGSGGRGGHILVRGRAQLHTLQDVAYHRSYKAERGAHGKGSCKHGKSGADVCISVPLGTLVYNDETGALLYDCLEDGQTAVVARGGRGGRGNAALASPKNRNPEAAEPGRPGEARRLRFVLKVLADIGLVGRPNAGKSTFLSKISRAHPRIADYPFTTTRPHLGIVKLDAFYDSFVVADIPGLIEGSHTGKGLGTRFLRHIERTRALAILVESTAADPQAEADMLLAELTRYSSLLAQKPHCCILTKNDLARAHGAAAPHGWFSISSATGAGIRQVVGEFSRLLKESGRDDSGQKDPKRGV
ncbi:MAG: GTPase ObgE [Chitinivibrionales bacterium]|nr:GTPase ObgE [Chitinivibrionales bacterium]MBD3394164.1 GTPase ObgE [Chitinivibrionales bacterium]